MGGCLCSLRAASGRFALLQELLRLGEGDAGDVAGSTNSFGDSQLALDIAADEAVFRVLRDCGAVASASSEEVRDGPRGKHLHASGEYQGLCTPASSSHWMLHAHVHAVSCCRQHRDPCQAESVQVASPTLQCRPLHGAVRHPIAGEPRSG